MSTAFRAGLVAQRSLGWKGMEPAQVRTWPRWESPTAP